MASRSFVIRTRDEVHENLVLSTIVDYLEINHDLKPDLVKLKRLLKIKSRVLELAKLKELSDQIGNRHIANLIDELRKKGVIERDEIAGLQPSAEETMFVRTNAQTLPPALAGPDRDYPKLFDNKVIKPQKLLLGSVRSFFSNHTEHHVNPDEVEKALEPLGDGILKKGRIEEALEQAGIKAEPIKALSQYLHDRWVLGINGNGHSTVMLHTEQALETFHEESWVRRLRVRLPQDPRIRGLLFYAGVAIGAIFLIVSWLPTVGRAMGENPLPTLMLVCALIGVWVVKFMPRLRKVRGEEHGFRIAALISVIAFSVLLYQGVTNYLEVSVRVAEPRTSEELAQRQRDLEARAVQLEKERQAYQDAQKLLAAESGTVVELLDEKQKLIDEDIQNFRLRTQQLQKMTEDLRQQKSKLENIKPQSLNQNAYEEAQRLSQQVGSFMTRYAAAATAPASVVAQAPSIPPVPIMPQAPPPAAAAVLASPRPAEPVAIPPPRQTAATQSRRTEEVPTRPARPRSERIVIPVELTPEQAAILR